MQSLVSETNIIKMDKFLKNQKIQDSPSTSKVLSTPASSFSGSAPNLTATEALENVNIPYRNKRLRNDDGNISEQTSFLEQLQTMFDKWEEKQDRRFKDLQVTVKEIKEQNDSIADSVNFLAAQNKELEDRLNKLEQERKAHLSYIQTLEDKMEGLERSSRSTSIEVRNIPVKNPETKSDLCNIIINAGKALNANISPAEIKDVYRAYSKPGTTKPIVVEFTTNIKKDEILTSVKKHNRDHRGKKLTTAQLRITGPETPVFISEWLTPKMKRIHFLARDFMKTYDYSYCWTSRGCVYLRKKEGAPAIRIIGETDLNKLKEQQK